MGKELVNALTKFVDFLRVLWFPPTESVDRVGWDYPLTYPCFLAVLRDETSVISWLSKASLESFQLHQDELRPS